MRRHARAGVRHAGSLYGRTFRWLLRPVRKIEVEAHHLHEVERVGDTPQTPLVAMLGVFLFLLPIFLVMLGLAIAAARIAG
jgi:hypothetical protein